MDLNLIRESLWRRVLKEGAAVAVGEWSPRERPSHKKMTSRAETSEKNSDRLLGKNSLKGESNMTE
jgi:hypothetical protein